MDQDLGFFVAATSALSSLIGLAGKADTVEYNRQVIELQRALMEAQVAMQKLTSRCSELEAQSQWTFHHSVDWKLNLDGTEDGPYCPICRADGKVMPLAVSRGIPKDQTQRGFVCPIEHERTIRTSSSYYVPSHLVKDNRYVFPE